jgi:LPXTG-site transpeptidase (sortase) family protein
MNLAKLLIILGAITIIFSGYLYWQRTSPQRLTFNLGLIPNTVASASASASMPVEIIIPAINLDLPVIPANLRDKYWDATTKGVSYLSSSPIPGTKGNSILYGHDWPNLLGNIHKLKPGQTISIKSANRKVNDFIIHTTAIVSPDDVSILAPSENAKITLYTCMGFFDDRRFVVTAVLK